MFTCTSILDLLISKFFLTTENVVLLSCDGNSVPIPKKDNDVVLHKHQRLLSDYKYFIDTHKPYVRSLLEIGVKNGGSAILWNEVFALSSYIGLDIDLSQLQAAFLEYKEGKAIDVLDVKTMSPKEVAKKVESVDLVIDDGSHTIQDILENFSAYWPILSPGCYYIIEDWSSLHKDHRLEVLSRLQGRLIEEWTSIETSKDAPWCILLTKSFIAIEKKQ